MINTIRHYNKIKESIFNKKYYFIIVIYTFFVCNTAFSDEFKFKINLDGIENKNINSVGNEWSFIFNINGNKNEKSIYTKNKENIVKIYNHKLISGLIDTDKTNHVNVGINIIEDDPSYNDMGSKNFKIYINPELNSNNLFFTKKIKVREGHGIFKGHETEWKIKLSMHYENSGK